eukprot:maker-scaffold353_size198981-snap-gene-0.30 protein:Tk05247 transcript:maker-scaffold353_size198981-snap-gene-0.30-mRNA-1 annotation:"glutamate receptor delta-2-like"
MSDGKEIVSHGDFTDKDDFEVVSDQEIQDASQDLARLDSNTSVTEQLVQEITEQEEEGINKVIEEVAKDESQSITEKERAIIELVELKSQFHDWADTRRLTIDKLREIADYVDRICKRTGFTKIACSGSGAVAGGLTILGGALTIASAGAALPIMLAGTGIGLASGITGGAAAVTEKIIKSKQMKEAGAAIEADKEATEHLETSIVTLQKNKYAKQIAQDVAKTGANGAYSSYQIMALVGVGGGLGRISGEAAAKIFGEDVGKEISKMIIHTSGRVISGSVTVVLGGVSMVYDIYKLNGELAQIAKLGSEGASEFRTMANQLEEAHGFTTVLITRKYASVPTLSPEGNQYGGMAFPSLATTPNIMAPAGCLGVHRASASAFVEQLVPLLNAKDPSSEFIHLIDTLVLVTGPDIQDEDLRSFWFLNNLVTGHLYLVQWRDHLDQPLGSDLSILHGSLERFIHGVAFDGAVCVFDMVPTNVEHLGTYPLTLESRTYGIGFQNGLIVVDEFFAYPPYGTLIQSRVETWNKFGIVAQSEYIWKRRSTLNGITLKVGAIPVPTYFELSSEDQGAKLEGLDVDLVSTLEKELNFTAEFIVPPDNSYGTLVNGTWNGLIRMLLEGEIDFEAPLLTQSLSRDRVVEFFTMTTSGHSMLVKTPRTMSHFIYGIFELNVWLAHLMVVILILMITLTILTNSWTTGDYKAIGPSVMMVYGALFNQGSPEIKICRRISFRILLMVSFFYGIVTLQFFSARLIAHLTSRVEEDNVHTISDVARLGYKVHLRRGEVTEDLFSKATIGSLEGQIWKRQSEDGKEKYLSDSHERLLEAFFAEEKAVTLSYHAGILRIIRDNLEEGCGLKVVDGLYPRPAGFAFHKNFQFRQVFEYKLAKMRESGIYDQLRKKWVLKEKNHLCSTLDHGYDEQELAGFPMGKRSSYQVSDGLVGTEVPHFGPYFLLRNLGEAEWNGLVIKTTDGCGDESL